MKNYLFILILFPLLLQAQEARTSASVKDSTKVKANLSLTGFWQSGNVETLIFRAKSDLEFKTWKKAVFKTQNSYVYQEFGKAKADEDILSLNFLYFNPEKRIYPQLLGFVSTNFRREIDLRYLLGAGATYQVIQGEERWLKMSLTAEYEHTDYKRKDFNRDEFDGNSAINTFRGTVWLNGRYPIFKKKMILTHESFFQPSLSQKRNFRWRADFGLEFPVWTFLNLKVNYLRTFESLVIEGQQRKDRFLTFGFTLKNTKY